MSQNEKKYKLSDAERASVHADNEKMLTLFSAYLNLAPCFVNRELLENVTDGETSMNSYAYACIMASVCGLDVYENKDDNKFFKEYFVPAVEELDADAYTRDPYFSEIAFPHKKYGKWELDHGKYEPYEAFVYDDTVERDNGRLLVKLGFFDKEFIFPRVKENGREWMTVTPNEINTMKGAIASTHGNVLTFGLGLGYFAYMAARRECVTRVTVVERDKEIIELFTREILPLMSCKSKIRIICADAFEFARTAAKNDIYDVIFTDIWHDASDGVELYRKMKAHEKYFTGGEFHYWIEPTLKIYCGEDE